MEIGVFRNNNKAVFFGKFPHLLIICVVQIVLSHMRGIRIQVNDV